MQQRSTRTQEERCTAINKSIHVTPIALVYENMLKNQGVMRKLVCIVFSTNMRTNRTKYPQNMHCALTQGN